MICFWGFLFFMIVLMAKPFHGEEMIQEIDFNGNWNFRAADETEWKPAQVPGCVHTDLLKNNLIANPYYGLNEEKLQWIDKKDWVYQKKFVLDSSMLKYPCIELCFWGLDTFAEVFLNDSLILKSSNAHRTYNIDISQWIREGENELIIKFQSAVLAGEKLYDLCPYQIPVSANDLSELGGLGGKRVSTFVRKPLYHFGWDWGPRFATCGIFRPVKLIFWDYARVNDVFVKQELLDEEEAVFSVNVELIVNQPGKYEMETMITDTIKEKKVFELKKGVNDIAQHFIIKKPRLWQPRVLGDPFLYQCNVNLFFENKKISSETVKFGLRNVELVQEEDSSGASFYFRINGKPLFAMGANMIPGDVFVADVSEEKITQLLVDAAEANMNMIRVWGGGIYPDNHFYNLCDSLGILVWQDFMFACAMIPGNLEFFENVTEEARQQIRRLRRHPSLVLWAGNNEVLGAWHNWGWKENVTKNQGIEAADYIENSYDTLFHKILPELVEELDSGRFYWASSPQSAQEIPDNLYRGDTHFWMVWWGKWLFEKYWENTSRFVSEYGFQSIPELSTLKKVMNEKGLDMESEEFSARQKSSGGNERLKFYLEHYYTVNASFEDLVYYTQLLQADAMRTAIDAHRFHKPYCMGSLLWQLNDCWPGISWSIIDYFGNKKAAYYSVKEAFEPVTSVIRFVSEDIKVRFVSSLDKNEPLSYSLQLQDFQGKTFLEKQGKVNFSSMKNADLIFTSEDLKGLNRDFSYFRIKIEQGNYVNERIHLLSREKSPLLPKSEFDYELMKDEKGVKLVIQSPVFLKSVHVFFPDEKIKKSIDYFDVLPGERKEIFIQTDKDLELIKKSLKIKVLNQL